MTQPLSGSNSGNASGDETVGRNVPCPCGSGKKYKRCHGKVDKPKISPMKMTIEGAAPSGRANAAWAEQLKAAGMDPGQVDPDALKNMQKMLGRMPKGQMQRMQALMQKAMAGKDVSREAQDLEKSLPPELLQQMQAMSGMMGQEAPGMPGEDRAVEEAETVEAASDMSAEDARKIVEKAVADGKLTQEQAERLLAGGGDSGIDSAESKKGFWKKLTRR